MTTSRCVELFADRRFQDAVWAEARRHSHRVDLAADFFGDAWVAISEEGDDDCDEETLLGIAQNAIVRAYRRKLRERKLIRELIETYENAGADPATMAPCGRRKDAGIILAPRRNRWRD